MRGTAPKPTLKATAASSSRPPPRLLRNLGAREPASEGRVAGRTAFSQPSLIPDSVRRPLAARLDASPAPRRDLAQTSFPAAILFGARYRGAACRDRRTSIAPQAEQQAGRPTARSESPPRSCSGSLFISRLMIGTAVVNSTLVRRRELAAESAGASCGTRSRAPRRASAFSTHPDGDDGRFGGSLSQACVTSLTAPPIRAASDLPARAASTRLPGCPCSLLAFSSLPRIARPTRGATRSYRAE